MQVSALALVLLSMKETQEYLEAQSTIDAWIAACCNAEEVDGQSRRYWAKANDLYLSYANWKDSRREDTYGTRQVR